MAIVFLVAYTIYAASSVKACGTLFHTVIGMDPQIAMYLAAVVIVGYTFLGGFSAVCWTDFFQGMLVLGSMFIAPIFAAFMLDTSSMSSLPGGYLNPFSSWQISCQDWHGDLVTLVCHISLSDSCPSNHRRI